MLIKFGGSFEKIWLGIQVTWDMQNAFEGNLEKTLESSLPRQLRLRFSGRLTMTFKRPLVENAQWFQI